MQGETIDINFKADIFQQLKELKDQFGQLNGKVSTIEQTSKKSFASVSQSLKAINFVSVTQGLQNISQGFQELNAPGLSFSSQMAEVSAITGVTGKQLESLGKKARESAKEFGGSAAESLDAYKTILSRLGPGIAKDEKALAGMERNVRILSKTMGGDAKASVDALTTAMLQYGVDLSNPEQAQKEMSRMMNVMAAGAKEGAAEVPQLSEALKVSGVAAKQAKVTFEETNSALQALAAGGREGAEAGTSLRNILGKMAGEDVIPKEAAMKLRALGVNMNIVSDTSLPFTTRLKELKKAQGDATAVAQVFGVENASAANILLNSISAQEDLTKKITGTNVAQEQASIVMATTEEKVKRMKASIDDAKISMFEATGGTTAYLEPVSQLAVTMSAFYPIIGKTGELIKWLGKTEMITAVATKVTTAAQWLWNAAMTANPIGAVIIGVTALAGVLYGVSKAFKNSTVSEQANALIKERVIDKTIDERVELDLLFGKLKSAKVGTDDYKTALKELDDKYPGILKKYDLQKGKIEDLNKAQKDLIKNIELQAEIEATKELLKEEKKNYLQEKLNGPAATDKISNYLATKLGLGNSTYYTDLQESRKKASVFSKQLQKLQGKNKSSNPVTDEKTENNNTTPPSDTPIVTPSGYSNSDKAYSGAKGEMKNINVRIENLVKEINVNTTNLTQGLGQIKQQVTEAIVSAVRDFEVSM